MEFRVYGRFPSFNDYTLANRTNKYAGAKMKKDAEELVILSIKRDLPQVHIKDPITCEFVWIETNKKRDLDNICFAKKFILDGMVKVGLISDDNWSHVQGFVDKFAIGTPMVIVRINEREQSDDKL